MIIYEAFIESELEVPKHLARNVQDQSGLTSTAVLSCGAESRTRGNWSAKRSTSGRSWSSIDWMTWVTLASGSGVHEAGALYTPAGEF